MNNLKAILLLLVYVFLGRSLFSQEKDAGLWLSANVEKRFSQAFGLSFSQELRLMENISEASTIFSDLGLEYRVTKRLRVAAHYRKSFDRQLDDYFIDYNRFYLDFSYRWNFKPVTISIRERAQTEFQRFNTSDSPGPDYYLRTKGAIKYDLNSNFLPYFSAEFFTPLNPSSSLLVDKARYSAGIEYQFLNRHTLDLNYMIQGKLDKQRETDYIIGLAYYLTL